MKIVDAFWEQRNLGVTCTEVTIDMDDTVEALASQLTALEGQYQVIKVPVARHDLMMAIEKVGFSFIEASMNVVHHLQQNELTGIRKRLNNVITYDVMDNADKELLYNELKKGIFTTDRVYLDNTFNKEQAAQRYIYWLEDEHNRGTELYKLVYKSKSVGFFVFKEIPNSGCYPFLSGLYELGTTPGFGNILQHKITEEALKRGLKFISSHISTNNLPILKVLLSEGYTIANICYVYTRHATLKQNNKELL